MKIIILILSILIIVLINITTTTNALTPTYHGCVTEKAKTFKYCDTSLSYEERLESLISELTLEEKVNLIAPDSALGSTCNDHTHGVERLDVPPYMWLVETNTAAASKCYAENVCATTFNGPIGLGATFNRTVWFQKGQVISTEIRAFNNKNWPRGTGDKDFIGITGYGPNINIARDPRFGRTSELPGEDPYLSGHYAKHMVHGTMETDKNGHPRMLTYLKHFTAYSTETNRGHDTYNISMHDFFDTYLAQYKIAFTEGKPVGAMCSYNAENGHPSCANDFILNKVVREMWKQPDAHITTDCGAVSNMLGAPVHAPSNLYATAWTIGNGTDLEMGTTLWNQTLVEAVKTNVVSVKTVEESIRRGYIHHFRAGRFDPIESVEWSNIDIDVVNSTEHRAIQYDAGLQAVVLLKNEEKLLPLEKGKKIAVVGPMGITHSGLLSDYAGDQQCYNDPNNNCIPTIAQAIEEYNVGGTTMSASGVDVNSTSTSGIADALKLVNDADIVILALGIDKTIEHEGHDRPSIGLPGQQENFAKQVLATKKPVVLILNNGGPLAIDDLIEPSKTIVEAFNLGGLGSKPLASLIFGDANKWGKMPYTTYPKNYINEQSMTNYDMAKAPGRTYRYYTGTPLFKFGQGESYTTFDMECKHDGLTKDNGVTLKCHLKNTGDMDGDEVIQVYHTVGEEIRSKANHPIAIKQLVEFERVSVAKGADVDVEISLTNDSFELVNEHGVSVVYPGEHTIMLERGVEGETPVKFTFELSN